MSLADAQAVRVKEEPEWESDAAAEQEVKDDPESEAGAQAGRIEHDVKEEPEWASEEGACGVSAAAAWASLYTDHTVKDELVVGPEEMHQPKIAALHPGFRRTCSVRLERMRVDMERRACRIGPHKYKFRLCSNTPQDNNSRKEINSSKDKFNGRNQQEDPSKRPIEKSSTNEEIIILPSTNTSKKAYKCAYCSYSSAHKYNVQGHVATHTGEKPYKCAHCSYSTARVYELKYHEKTHKYAYCSTARKYDLKHHENTHSGKKPYKCAFCSFIVADKNNSTLKCAHYSYSSAHTDHLIIHLGKHSGEKPYKCAHCSYSTVRKDNLRLHEKVHSAEKTYKCAYCSFTDAYKCNLKMHEKTHSGEKPYKCAYCSFRTAYKSNLKNHEKAHSDQEP